LLSQAEKRNHTGLHKLNRELIEYTKITYLIKIMKFQAPKTKFQTNSNDPNSKFQTNDPPAFEPNGIITDGQSLPAAI
jgi:hypothetical protein